MLGRLLEARFERDEILGMGLGLGLLECLVIVMGLLGRCRGESEGGG